MTTSSGFNSARCPQCGTVPFAVETACTACGFPLNSAEMPRIRELDERIFTLQTERAGLVNAVSSRQTAAAEGYARAMPTWLDHMADEPRVKADPDRQQPTPTEWTPQKVQNLLLWLGAALCATAALLFIAFAWNRLGLGGRAAVLIGLTGATGLIGHAALTRGLRSTAETISSLAVLLAVIDAGAARALDFGHMQDVPGFTYWAGVSLLYSVLLVLYRAVANLTSIGALATLTAQVPVPLLLMANSASSLVVAIAMGLQAIALLVAYRPLKGQAVVAELVRFCAVLTWGTTTVAVLSTAAADAPSSASSHVSHIIAVLVMALSAGISAIIGQRRESSWAKVATGAALALLAIDSLIVGGLFLSGYAVAIPVAACAVVLAAGASLVPVEHRSSATWVAACTSGVAVLAPAVALGEALAGQMAWTAKAWEIMPGTSAVDSLNLSPSTTIDASALVVLALAAIGFAWIGDITKRRDLGFTAALLAGVAAVDLLPLVIDAPYGFGVFTTLMLGIVCTFVGRLVKPGVIHSDTLTAVGCGIGFQALAWSTASDVATIAVLFAISAAGVVLAIVDEHARPAASIVVSIGVMTWTYTTTLYAGSTVFESGFAVAVVASFLAIAGDVFPVVRSRALLSVAGAGALVGISCTTADASWFLASLVASFAGTALVAAAPDRRPLAALAAVLLMLTTGAAADILDWPAGQAGFVVVLVAAGAGLLADRLKGAKPELLLSTAFLGAVAGLCAATTSEAWLAATFLAASAGTSIVGMQPQRKALRWAGAGLALCSLWTRLDMAGVQTVEAYSLPLAAVVLFAGYRAARKDPTNSSWNTYSPGFAMALVPSLWIVNSGDTLMRPGLLAIGALATLFFGATAKLRAPLVIGSAVLLIDALVQFWPEVSHVPRWVAIGFIGAMLLFLGATYERRRRDARLIKDRYEALT